VWLKVGLKDGEKVKASKGLAMSKMLQNIF